MQTTRLSTKARDEMEALSDLLTHIAHDGVFSDAEWLACERQMRRTLLLIEQTDDAQALGMAAMKGGVTRHVRELTRQYDETHGTVVHLPVRMTTGPDRGNGPSAA